MERTLRRRLRNLVLMFGVLACVGTEAPKAWGQAVNVDAAKKDGKVVIYGTIVPQIMNLIQKGFEEKI
jgi:hypothetical protein